MVRLDSKHCTILCQALAGYTRHETTGDPRKDNYYEHVSDAYKLGCYYMMKKVVNSVDVDTKEPEYFSMDFGARSAERKTVS